MIGALCVTEASESGGDGGVGTSDLIEAWDFDGGGVETVGEEEEAVREMSEAGDLGTTEALDR